MIFSFNLTAYSSCITVERRSPVAVLSPSMSRVLDHFQGSPLSQATVYTLKLMLLFIYRLLANAGNGWLGGIISCTLYSLPY